MFAERVGSEQTVIADVPPGGMPRVFGMVEDGEPDSFSIHWAVIIAPLGALAPGFLILHAAAVHDMTVADRTLEPHRFGQAHGHRAFFRISKNHLFVRSMEGDLEIKHSFIFLPGIMN